MKRLVSSALAACSLLLIAPASAQLAGNPERYCRDGYFPRESKQYRLAKIKGAPGDKAYFHDDGHERCPADQSCRLKSYVIPNDEVIVSRTLDKFACSWFQRARGAGTVGWIETERLAWVGSVQSPIERDWLGAWRTGGSFIQISKSKKTGWLAVKGEATWGSGSNMHTGALDHDAKPSGDRMTFGDGTDEFDCQVEIQLVGKYLIVGDNLHCGGANVSFSGVYQKRTQR